MYTLLKIIIKINYYNIQFIHYYNNAYNWIFE